MRVLAVLTRLAADAQPVRATTLVEECGIPKQTLYPMLADMEAAGFVTYFPDERRWGLGVTAFEIGSAYLRAAPLQRLSGPILTRLASQVGETSHLAILLGNEVLYLLKERPSESTMHLISDVGVRIPAHLTAVGRSILAHLPPAQLRAIYPSDAAFVQRTGRGAVRLSELRSILRGDRERGFSMETDSTSEGVTCIAAAVHDHRGEATASVGVSFATASRPSTEWPALAARVQQAAQAVTARIGGARPTSGTA